MAGSVSVGLFPRDERASGEKSSSDEDEGVEEDPDDEDEWVDAFSRASIASVCVLSRCLFSVQRWHKRSEDCTSSKRQARWNGWLQSSQAIREPSEFVQAVQTSGRAGDGAGVS